MSLAKSYDPGQHEAAIYALWEKSGAFLPEHRGSDEYYSIVMPPPNANADIHIGYALTAALEDIPARYHRMKGKATLLLPGADHAGFETQSVYEKHLAKEGKSRFDFSRAELYSQIWDFVAQNKASFETQIRSLGVSADWTRFTFTLDKKIVDTAYQTFKKMWDEGLIYRGERLVNYCTFHGTGFADIEVEYREQQGSMWSLRYPLTDGSGEVVVATTRPETMLGDVAVAVHPKDARYSQFIGKTVKLPLTHRELPILADEFVDQSFGTGAVKITPAHDVNDFEVAERHDLPKLSVINHDGTLNHNVPEQYQGLTVKEARKKVLTDLKEQGWLVDTKDHTNSVGHCYKCGTVIEPLLKEQWFINMEPLAKNAIDALTSKKITFYPHSKMNQLIRYLEGLRDWNISRQIAWGIPIPAFQNVDDPEDWVFDTRVDDAILQIDGKTYRRDTDVFDTWFSSSSWPYATLDFPDGSDFATLYPLSLMETGGEILYPWVSRMIMLGLYATSKVPFKEVYIHGYVMAEDGSKMSKSIGNVVDPLPIVQKYGSDALRMGIISGRSPAVNRGYDPRKVEDARNFANKLWNIARFVESAVGMSLQPNVIPHPTSVADHWVLERLNTSTTQISSHIEKYRFSEAYELLYHLVWDEIADWYIEFSKTNVNDSVLAYTLMSTLTIAHPFAPFVTEAIWQKLFTTDGVLATHSWPSAVPVDPKKAKEFEAIRRLVSEIRQIKTLTLSNGGQLYFESSRLIENNVETITRLARLRAVKEAQQGRGVALTKTDERCWLEIDTKKIHEFLRSQADRQQDLQQKISHLEVRLHNKSYLQKAPKHLVAESRAQLDNLTQELETVTTQINQFSQKSS